VKTVITSKFQTTIPKAIREKFGLSVHDTLDWRIERGRIVVNAAEKDFRRFRGSVGVGPGRIDDDIARARRLRAERSA